MDYSAYNNETYEKARNYLMSGEEIIWTGKPGKSLKSQINIPVFIFSIIWTGMALFMELTVLFAFIGGIEGEFDISLLFLIAFISVFVLVGLFLMYSATFGQVKANKYTHYVLTDKKVMVIKRVKGADNCQNYLWSNISSVNLQNVRDGKGSLVFTLKNFSDVYNSFQTTNNIKVNGRYLTPSGLIFSDIDNVQTVYSIAMQKIEENQ